MVNVLSKHFSEGQFIFKHMEEIFSHYRNDSQNYMSKFALRNVSIATKNNIEIFISLQSEQLLSNIQKTVNAGENVGERNSTLLMGMSSTDIVEISKEHPQKQRSYNLIQLYHSVYSQNYRQHSVEIHAYLCLLQHNSQFAYIC